MVPSALSIRGTTYSVGVPFTGQQESFIGNFQDSEAKIYFLGTSRVAVTFPVPLPR